MTSSAKWSLTGMILVLAVLVALVPRLLGSPGSPDSAEPADGSADGSAEASTSVVAQRPDCVDTGAAGVPLPCLGGGNGAGNEQATVVNLWAWWCGPCRTELPVFDEFAAAHPELNVVGVHADANAANGAAMLDELGIGMSSYQDDANLFAGTLGLPSVVPITIVVDPAGEVVGTYPRTFDSVADLEDAVAEAL